MQGCSSEQALGVQACCLVILSDVCGVNTHVMANSKPWVCHGKSWPPPAHYRYFFFLIILLFLVCVGGGLCMWMYVCVEVYMHRKGGLHM